MSNTKKTVIFCSGAGSNLINIHRYFSLNKNAEVLLLVTNKPDCGAALYANNCGIPVLNCTKESLPTETLETLKNTEPDIIVLAGFLLKIPQELVAAFPNKIINIHPALLPKFGGKGMYGKHVHQAVYDAKETETGITIHYVNEHYDEGSIIAQFKVGLNENDTPEAIEQKVRELELKHYPEIIQQLLI
jgi:phosphoribosylglycinamide formyltransferase 1